jgi:hypothetical protein
MKGNFLNKKANRHTHTQKKGEIKTRKEKEKKEIEKGTEGCNWTTVIRIQESQNLPSFTLYRRRKGN